MPDDRQHDLTHDLIVIGGSAGGLEALMALAAGLPPNLPAAVCVVLHQPAYLPSRIAEVVSRCGPLPARDAAQGAPLERGVIHVAVRDHHLLVDAGGSHGMGCLRLTRGPKENRARPAIDPLFRSAALAFGPRVIAVVLSGALDDGTAGLWAVRDRGGISVVQDPEDALVTSMPASAIAEVGADHVAAARDIGPLLGQLARAPMQAVAPDERAGERVAELQREVAMAAVDEDTHERPERYGVPSRFVCPDCSGVLWDTTNGRGPLRLRCTTGHAYSAAWLGEAQTEHVEAALWAALRALEDKAELARIRSADAEERGIAALATRYRVQFEAAEAQAAAVRALLRLDGQAGMRAGDPPADVATHADHEPAADDTAHLLNATAARRRRAPDADA